MKKLLLLMVLNFSSAYLLNCETTPSKVETTFQPLKQCNDKVDVSGTTFSFVFCLTQNEALAVGVGTPELGEALYLIDRKTMQATYQSGPNDSPYGWSLYQSRTDTHITILWKIEGEYCSEMRLYVFDSDSRHITYVGDFDVALPFRKDIDTYPFPIEDIRIASSDTLVFFRFPHRLMLRPFDPDAHEVDSVVYELNFRGNSLKIKSPEK